MCLSIHIENSRNILANNYAIYLLNRICSSSTYFIKKMHAKQVVHLTKAYPEYC